MASLVRTRWPFIGLIGLLLGIVSCDSLLGIEERGALGAGSNCSLTSDCASGFCVEGVCCEQACNRVCETCTLPERSGKCMPRPQGSVCGEASQCDFDGECREPLAAPGGPCVNTTDCLDGVCVGDRCCDRVCDIDEQCAVDGVCRLRAGELCVAEADCASGVCEDGRCCEQACGATERCSSQGECRLLEGEACGSDLECAGGECVDGVCCDSACDGTCERCNGVQPGSCAAVALDEDPDAECGASCDGAGQCRDVVRVYAGGAHSCASLSDGSVKCWGANSSGQLGGGISSYSAPPTTVMLSKTPTDITLGDSHSCALFSGGAIQCWGRNNAGQLGLGGNANSATPVAVLPLGNGTLGAQQISAGYEHTCAVRTDGALFCWGSNGAGELGNGSFMNSATPQPVVGLDGSPGNEVVAVAAGGSMTALSHTCALLADSSMRCWGYNGDGQLGDGSFLGSAVPVTVLPVAGNSYTSIAAGRRHNCARLSDGSAACWGQNVFGQLGSAGPGTSKPAYVTGLGGMALGISHIDTGANHTCAKLIDNTFRCWGGNQSAQLGDGSNVSSDVPIEVTLLAGRMVSSETALATGLAHNCVGPLSGGLLCWGSDSQGQVTGGDIAVSP